MTYTIPKIYTYWFRVFFVGIGVVAEKLVKGENNFPSNFYNSHIAAPFIVNGNPIQSSSKSKQKFWASTFLRWLILGTYSVFGPFRGAALVTGILATMTEEFFGIISSSFVYAVKLWPISYL